MNTWKLKSMPIQTMISEANKICLQPDQRVKTSVGYKRIPEFTSEKTENDNVILLETYLSSNMLLI